MLICTTVACVMAQRIRIVIAMTTIAPAPLRYHAAAPWLRLSSALSVKRTTSTIHRRDKHIAHGINIMSLDAAVAATVCVAFTVMFRC